MSFMVIDAGNTKIKFVRWDDDVPMPDFHTAGFLSGKAKDEPTVLASVPTELLNNPSEFFSRIQTINTGDIASSVLVSVVPETNGILQKKWPHLVVVAHNGDYPFAHKLQQPETVGPDRFCNVAAAVAGGLKSALIVDAGTATTFDLLLDDVFVGGLIAPGMAFAAVQLARQGAMLEEVPFQEMPSAVGINTTEAMMTGAWLTGCGGVQWTIARLLETYGQVPVILTGGLSELLPQDGRYHDPFWTLRGAAFLARKSLPSPEPEVR